MSLMSSEGLKLRSRLKISSRPAYTGMSFFFFFFFEFCMKNHFKWMSQHMINNNSINNNNDNNNDNPPVVLIYRVGIRRRIVGQVGIISLGW